MILGRRVKIAPLADAPLGTPTVTHIDAAAEGLAYLLDDQGNVWAVTIDANSGVVSWYFAGKPTVVV